MRYANILFRGKELCNIGDHLQLMAIDHLYMCMGIKTDEIVYIPYDELGTWKSEDGEKVLLPINFPFLEFIKKGLAGIFSSDITPVFLGLTYIKPYLDKWEVDYLKQYEPIGCRDEYTYNTLQKEGIQSWLNGCMTLTLFSKRKCKLKEQKVYLVDVPAEIEERLPCNILTNAVKRTQVVNIETIHQNINDYVITRFQEYEENAKMVITTRLHCAVPCISMGIPVILILPKVSYRFSWVEQLMPIYSIDDIENIDWNPLPKDCDEIKKKVLENAINMLEFCRTKNVSLISQNNIISGYYLQRNKENYYVEGFDKAIDYLKKKYQKNDEFTYAVWGLTYVAEMICKYITVNYPHGKLVSVFDKNKEIIFEGKRVQKIEEFPKDKIKDIEVFVTAFAATTAAKKYFDEIESKQFCLCYI